MTVPIVGEGGLPPKLAVAGFLALSNDGETTAAAKTIADVLFDDLKFEREFYIIEKDAAATVPPPTSIDQLPLDRWRELNAMASSSAASARRPPASSVQVHVVEVAVGANVARQGVQRLDCESAALRAHDRRRDPQAAARV